MEKSSKMCSKCKKQKPLSDFYKSKSYGYTYQCKSCDKEYRIKKDSGLITPIRRIKEDELGKQILLPDGRIRIKHKYKNGFINRYYKNVECTHCKTSILREVNNLKNQKFAFCQNCIGLKSEYVYKMGSKKKASGHILIYSPNHPSAVKKFVPEHRLIVEKEIGRYLRSDEIIHHIDCIKDNNIYDNLYLTNSSGHTIAHNSLNECVKPLLDANLIYFDRNEGVYKVNGLLIAEYCRRTKV